MSWHAIAECYDDIVKDPPLLWLFLEKEWISIQELTLLGHHNQAKMESSNALSALCQCNSTEPSVVVVSRYTNNPYIPWGSSCLLYLDVSTLSQGTSSAHFPLDWLCLCRLLPFSDTEVVLPQEEGEMGLKVFPYFLHWPLSPIRKRAHRQREDWAFTQLSGFYKMPI